MDLEVPEDIRKTEEERAAAILKAKEASRAFSFAALNPVHNLDHPVQQEGRVESGLQHGPVDKKGSK